LVSKASEWETRLWSYLSIGDGMHCPQFTYCATRLKGDYCPDTNKDEFSRLIDSDGHFDPARFDHARLCGESIMQYVARLAEQELRRGNTTELPVPTDLVQLASEEHPVEIRNIDLRACYAATWLMPDGWVIQVSDTVPTPRKRVALFHEAFHIIAHDRCRTPVFGKRGVTQGSFNELLADYFAICILMPEQQVREQWAKLSDVDRMAIAFDVPKSTMWLRLREINLID
jgi:hypothetical protein